jgi:prepilin-type N-terminal cleavage/methylation domain-containing protein
MKNSRGFTLIELAIVLTIISLLIGGMAAVLQNYILKKREAELIQKTDAITSALALYIQDESFYGDNPLTAAVETNFFIADPNGAQFPCPADPRLGPGEAGYGLESRSPPKIDPSDPALGPCDASWPGGTSGSGSTTVYHGAVPFLDLGLTADQTIDPYKNRFSYSVSKTVSDPDAYKLGRKPEGAIEVERYKMDGTPDTSISNVSFVLVAAGPTGEGAYGVASNSLTPCNNSARDGENCDGDNVFVDANDYRVNKNGSSEFYDDTIFTSLRGIADKEEYWANSQDGTGEHVVNMNPGNVGIGPNVDAPKARLHVQANTSVVADNSVGGYDGSGGSNFSFIAEGDGNDSGGILITTTDTDDNQNALTVFSSELDSVIFDVTATNGNTTIAGNTDIGGNTTIAGNTDIGGDTTIAGETTAAKNLTVGLNVTAAAYLYSSDQRLKENIRDLDPDTLKNLMLLRIIKYNLIEGNGDDKIGVIAQQLREYFPELVHEDENGMLAVDYVGLVGPIIKAIQEMQTEHKNDVDELEARIEQLEEAIQHIKDEE